jgi:hypothetical protein
MKRCILVPVAMVLLLGGCMTHQSYDYFAPSGPWKVMSNFSGAHGPGPDEYVLVEQPGLNLFFFATPTAGDTGGQFVGVEVIEIGNREVANRHVESFLERSLTIEALGKSYKPTAERVLESYGRQAEVSVSFGEAPKNLESFTLQIQLLNGASTSMRFEKKHASYWRVQSQLM